MLMDLETLLSDEQDLSQTTGNYLSTNTIDLGATGTPMRASPLRSDPGEARNLEVLIQVITAFTSANSTATVQFQLVMADNDALDSNLTVVSETPAIVVTSLTQGYKAKLAVPPGIDKRYLGVRYVIGTQTTTAGTCTAGLLLDLQTH